MYTETVVGGTGLQITPFQTTSLHSFTSVLNMEANAYLRSKVMAFTGISLTPTMIMNNKDIHGLYSMRGLSCAMEVHKFQLSKTLFVFWHTIKYSLTVAAKKPV